MRRIVTRVEAVAFFVDMDDTGVIVNDGHGPPAQLHTPFAHGLVLYIEEIENGPRVQARNVNRGPGSEEGEGGT